MIYIIKDSNFYNKRDFYSFDTYFYNLWNKISTIDDVLIAYNNHQKKLNKAKRIKRKFGFSSPEKFDIKKCKENIILHRNIMSYDENRELLFDMFDYVNAHNKILVLFTNDELYYYLNQKMLNYINEEEIKHKIYDTNSHMDFDNKTDILIKNLIRDLKISKILF